MNIGFATVGDARKVGYWSGTPYNMAHALMRAGHEVTFLGPLNTPFLPIFKAYARIGESVGLSPRRPLQTQFIAARLVEDLNRKVGAARPDIVIAVAGSVFAGRIPKGIPVIYASDATFRVLVDYHFRYRKTSPQARKAADEMERSSIARADLVTYPSQWAAASAVADYGADPSKVAVIPWGANVEAPPAPSDAPRRPGPCRLLMVGVDWVQKGADIAVETLDILTSRGFAASLTICGCTPPHTVERDNLTIIPFLDKSDPAQRQQLSDLYRDADLFIMPTKADCYGIVFCEASANGLPSIAPATGGVAGAVRPGVNGLLVPADAPAARYADAIIDLFADQTALGRLSQSSRRHFETTLNWDAWGKALAERIKTL